MKPFIRDFMAMIMIQDFKRKAQIILGAIGTIGILAFLFAVGSHNKVQPEVQLGVDLPGGKWFVYGDQNKFTGYHTKDDPSKVEDGDNPQGQNTFINNGDRISIRDFGYTLFPAGTASGTNNGVTTEHTFRKRSGESIQMRAEGQYVDWYDSVSSTWEILNSGYTPGYDFGFAEFNINTDLVSYVYFGNSQEPFSRWSGAHTNLTAALALNDSSIAVADTTDGFTTTGSVEVCGVSLAYSSKTNTQFNLSSSSTIACGSGRGIAQAVLTNTSNPRGNIYLVANNRLFISGVTSTPQAVFFSKYGDATTFVTTTLVSGGTATDSGIFNLAEGGGGVTALAQDESAIYIFKRSIIYRATLTDQLYTLLPLKPFDGKSRTTGAINQKSTFAGGNGIFFITPDNQIMNLTRIQYVDYPQIIPISDPIKPTVDAAIFTSSTGIFWRDKAYIAAKTDSNSSRNDVIFVYNFRRQAWESPIIGWNVGDWNIYDDGAGEQLYFGHAITPNTYKVSALALDDIYGVTANWRSKQYDFSEPQGLKEIDDVFIEGYISDNTSLTVSLLLDDNGNTQIFKTTIAGTETSFLYDSPLYNLFGFSPFGTERFGSNNDFSGKKKFRVYLNKNLRRVPFYNAQLEFASDGENQQWEILRYGFLVRESSQPEDRARYRVFN